MSPQSEAPPVEVRVRAKATRWLRVVMFLLLAGRKLGYRPSAERQKRLVDWLVERSEIEVLEPPHVSSKAEIPTRLSRRN